MDPSTPKMEARAAGATAVSETTVPRPRQRPGRSRAVPAEDPYRLGWRDRLIETADGRTVWEQVPLTHDDLVYPEEGDNVSQGLPHFSFLHPQADSMRRYLGSRPGLVVTSDVTLVLRHDSKNSAPDVAAIRGDFDPDTITGAIRLEVVGGHLCFALEAVSTSSREIENKDIETNEERYAAEGVEEYFTLYPKSGGKVSDLLGRRLDPKSGKYRKIAPDAQGRVYSKTLDLYFSIDAKTEELVVVDAQTGERFLLSDEEQERRQQAEQRAEQAEQRAEQEAEARQKAEQRAEKAEREKQEMMAKIEQLQARIEQQEDA